MIFQVAYAVIKCPSCTVCDPVLPSWSICVLLLLSIVLMRNISHRNPGSSMSMWLLLLFNCIVCSFNTREGPESKLWAPLNCEEVQIWVRALLLGPIATHYLSYATLKPQYATCIVPLPSYWLAHPAASSITLLHVGLLPTPPLLVTQVNEVGPFATAGGGAFPVFCSFHLKEFRG